MKLYTPQAKKFAQKLRKQMTPAEVCLWQRLRRKQINNLQFYRQKPIGKYIVDFYCARKSLVIEIDGGGHYENGDLVDRDVVRDQFLQTQGLTVLRFTNTDVLKNLNAVLEKIYKVVEN